MPPTIKAKLLLGWMPRQEALDTLNKCVFATPLSEQDKIDLWNKYKERVDRLTGEHAAPQTQKLSLLEKSNVTTFLKKLKGTPVRRVIKRAIKVHPGQLVIRQFMVITDRASAYENRIVTDRDRIRYCLGIGMEERHKIVPVRKGNKEVLRLPHFEFEVKARLGGFDINEMARFMSVITDGDRMILWGGYHRSHALLSQMTPEAEGTAPLFILMNGAEVEDAVGFLGDDSDRPTVRDALRAERPPVLADFFERDLCMEVDLLKERREVHIEPTGNQLVARWVFAPDES